MAAIPEPSVTVAKLIDAWWVKNTKEKPRPHLGASLLGHPCERWLWLSFRWALKNEFEGRLLRLFARGKREELSIVDNLRRIGIEIHSIGDDQQWVDFGCHVGGSVDGIIEKGVPEAPTKRHIAEFKTHNLKSFTELKKLGVWEAKRRHWCQMQCYMLGTGIDRALYVAICKDNDEIYTERVHFDKERAEQIVERGKRITLTERIPDPISFDSSWYQCRRCPAYAFCHEHHMAENVNCRTCARSTPCKDSKWRCAYFKNSAVTYEEQLIPCPYHIMHPDLMPWKLLGESEDGRGAYYEIDGTKILNGCGKGSISSVDLLAGKRAADPEDVDVPF